MLGELVFRPGRGSAAAEEPADDPVGKTAGRILDDMPEEPGRFHRENIHIPQTHAMITPPGGARRNSALYETPFPASTRLFGFAGMNGSRAHVTAH